MNFGMQDQDEEVIRLLSKLKDTGPEYPHSMYTERRTAVLAGLVALNLGAGVAGLTLLGHLFKIIKGMGIVEKIILGVEVAAVTGMTAYGAATAYIHRDEIGQLLRQNFETITTTPWPTLAAPGVGVGVSPAVATEEALLTGTPTPSATPSPTGTLFYTDTPEPGGGGGSNSTPGAPNQPEPTNPGNHYGQTENPPTKKPPKP